MLYDVKPIQARRQVVHDAVQKSFVLPSNHLHWSEHISLVSHIKNLDQLLGQIRFEIQVCKAKNMKPSERLKKLYDRANTHIDNIEQKVTMYLLRYT